MARPIFIRGARQLLTLRGPAGVRTGAALNDLATIEDGSLLVRDGVIEQVGSTRRLENLKEARDAIELAVQGRLVMPGFVDASIQVCAACSPTNPSRLQATAFYDHTLSLVRAATQHGTLHAQLRIQAESGDLRANFSALRQIASLATRAGGFTRTWRIEREGASETFRTVVERKLAHRIEVAANTGIEEATRCWETAHAEQLGVNLEWQGRANGDVRSALQMAQPRAVILDGVLAENECAALAETQVPVVVAPARCFVTDVYQGSIERLLHSGSALALASGYHEASSPVFNMQMSIALAVGRLGVSTEQAISAATVNAAYAAGVGHATGTLEAGKRADLLVLDVPDYRELPHRFGTNHVVLAMREGKLVVNRTGRKVSLT